MSPTNGYAQTAAGAATTLYVNLLNYRFGDDLQLQLGELAARHAGVAGGD